MNKMIQVPDELDYEVKERCHARRISFAQATREALALWVEKEGGEKIETPVVRLGRPRMGSTQRDRDLAETVEILRGAGWIPEDEVWWMNVQTRTITAIGKELADVRDEEGQLLLTAAQRGLFYQEKDLRAIRFKYEELFGNTIRMAKKVKLFRTIEKEHYAKHGTIPGVVGKDGVGRGE